jgi:diguanylate cyclase
VSASLVVVGLGIQLGRHVSERALSEIRRAEVVFGLADCFAMAWLEDLRPDLKSLAVYYGDNKDRRQTYRDMTAAVMAEISAGRSVCLILYGHPGVFAEVSHRSIDQCRQQGVPARMEPGISADACLYADLSIDPGDRGVQAFEATQFLISRRQIDPSALLILWQVALSGNLDCIGFEPDPKRLALLVEKLARWYRPDTEIILYEAARLPVESFRAERLRLAELPQARFKEYTTLVIEPAAELDIDPVMVEALRTLD